MPSGTALLIYKLNTTLLAISAIVYLFSFQYVNKKKLSLFDIPFSYAILNYPCTLKAQNGKEVIVLYSPKIREDLIPKLYQIAKRKGVPMTELVNGIIRDALETKYKVDRKGVDRDGQRDQ